MKREICFIILTVSAFILGYTVGTPSKKEQIEIENQLSYLQELTKSYGEYYDRCEELIDSINSWDDCFLDTAGETDVYYSYYESKCNVDKLLYSEQ